MKTQNNIKPAAVSLAEIETVSLTGGARGAVYGGGSDWSAARGRWAVAAVALRIPPACERATVEDNERARGAGLLSLCEVEAIERAEDEARAARVARGIKQRARAAWRKARAADDAAADDAAQVAAIERARRYEAARAAGALGDGCAMAALGSHLPASRRAAIERAADDAARGVGEGWHECEALAAQDRLRSLRGEETRAAAAGMLRDGLRGRAAARASRIAKSCAARWMRRNSRREAANAGEVGGAAGVDDRQAWADWSGELLSAARAVHLRAAAYGCAMVSAPLPPCAALVARGATGGAVASLRLAILGRGRRVDGLPVVEWSESGRTVRADSIGISNRGAAWVWAARQTARELHSLRYGRGGRDGREVPAGVAFWGSVAAAPPSSAPGRSAGSGKRAAWVAGVRSALADRIREARENLAVVRELVLLADSPADRIRLGSKLGAARNAVIKAAADGKNIGGALVGGAVSPEVFAAWMDGAALTGAGRVFAHRLRAAVAGRVAGGGARPVAAVPLAIAAAAAWGMGDERARETSSVS